MNIDLTEAVEALAREMACLEPGDPWPTNEQLGGGLTGTRDDEYRDGMRDQARDSLAAVAPLIERAVRERIAADIEAQANDYLALAPTGTFETSRHNGLTAAARIARGEVTP